MTDHEEHDEHGLIVEAVRSGAGWQVTVAACPELDPADALLLLDLIDDAVADVRRDTVATLASRN